MKNVFGFTANTQTYHKNSRLAMDQGIWEQLEYTCVSFNMLKFICWSPNVSYDNFFILTERANKYFLTK